MATRGISSGLQLFVRSQQIKLLKSINTTQFTRIFSSNNVKSKYDITLSPGVLLKPYNLNYSIIRWKYGKKQKPKGNKDDSDEEDEDEEEEKTEDLEMQSLVAHSKNAKIINTTVCSMRIDVIVKAGMNMARNKVEIALYESKLRLNGRKPPKKALQIGIGDVIDFVHGPSPKNENFLLVTRITMVNAKLHENNYKVKILREKALVIEDYEDSAKPVLEE